MPDPPRFRRKDVQDDMVALPYSAPSNHAPDGPFYVLSVGSDIASPMVADSQGKCCFGIEVSPGRRVRVNWDLPRVFSSHLARSCVMFSIRTFLSMVLSVISAATNTDMTADDRMSKRSMFFPIAVDGKCLTSLALVQRSRKIHFDICRHVILGF